MAAAKKKTVKKRSARNARKPPRKRTGKASTRKKPAKKSKVVVRKAKKATKKPVTKRAAKKSVKKSVKAKSKKSVSTPKQTNKPKKSGKPSKAGLIAKPAPASLRENIFYITTAIAYPNGVPHIGHAYEAIATDALARFQRLDGKDVFFLTGTDEHGLKMAQTAELEKLPTLEVATRNAQRFKDMDERLNVSFDRFIRTTEEQHHRSSQEIWKRMAANGDIYLDSYAGWYSVRDEAYYAEDETHINEHKV
ncbi:MAG: methionine--tRNA ligase, partial [Bradyrhizobium sp.]|nr:methionine--tRNA ligase [Bradyrhizobium sp.]